MKLTKLMQTLPVYQTIQSIEHIEVNGIEMDSRAIQNGNVFICINGYTVDGHDFVDQAIHNGAVAIVAERPLQVSVPVIVVQNSARAMAKLASYFYHQPTQQLHLIGVTGTNGKTTTSYLIDRIFRAYNQRTGLIGTIQMNIVDQSYEVKNTTPDALFLQRHFAKMVDHQVNTAVMEVSSHALDLGRVHGCDFDVAVFTNLSQDHLDYHKDMDDYLRAKSLLFSQLGNHYTGKPKYAVVNRDDSASEVLIKSTAHNVVTYGLHSEATVKAEQVKLTANGTSFILVANDERIAINSKLIGRFSVYNMLAAASAAWVSGVPLSTIKEALEQTTGVSGRFEPVLCGQDFGVIVDYAHTPDSLENVLQTIQSFVEGKAIVVVGCGGNRDASKRPLMANVAVQHATKAIFTSDNPRKEDPVAILNDMEAGVVGQEYEVIVDRREAICAAIQQAQPGDVVLIAGKGHETYQEVNGVRSHFDDREVATECIEVKQSKEK
ncbi:UDP-N-acetylmuramoyl-L-alanyl-D-glutamate--2,6-diaminopimelate ligase [Pontibacillus litoralis]|uniref:UDP-N-acetylmuramoyl-L-alanyl-D-glutamate--2,6-diaminopimelate ligase n=1 Tax=Pontibacillus litoralis JSM 072002 TaxID=1385512 RepID=A0A0A5HY67_9BACI|nr:UDP-N-acetylmuramoyl-L-alanyl-D-glutamate--2,6-diaminopimelate ligase [Pontibacillus litoralis]KGX88542.1 UDP-N-acetylmuramoylalanyl-D-glutamate--2,6-diaminopimelate ligase [Pontibacillus litoralis JSM 072002]